MDTIIKLLEALELEWVYYNGGISVCTHEDEESSRWVHVEIDSDGKIEEVRLYKEHNFIEEEIGRIHE